MNILPQIESVSTFRANQEVVLSKVKTGPVLLMQRSHPACVMVDPQEWNAIAAELQRFRALEVADQRAKEMWADPEKQIPFTKEELIKRGVIDG